ncbi:MAG TPA: sulfite dehydrogenase [Alphaproteobacteria bacterium]|nr:sulfite dehydrogenase [Alphaproteobacteria bacterium]
MTDLTRRGRAPLPDFVAGNGLINRRALLGRGIAVAGAVAAGATVTGAAAEPLKEDPWGLDVGGLTPALQTPSPFEKNVTRILSNPNGEPRTSHARTPHHLLYGTVTPNSLHFSINHVGIPNIDPAQHKLVIHGDVRQPLEFDLETLSRYPLVTRMQFVECAGNSAAMFSNEPVQATAQALHGLVSNAEWSGVPLSVLLDEAGVDQKDKWIVAEGADAGHLDRSIPVKKAYDDAIVAIYQNGERLMPGNGYPMRLLVPGYQGNMNVKFLRRLKVVDQPAYTYFETRNYSQILPGGKTWRFHFLMEVKSFITHPSFGHHLKEPGYYTVSGIAYSGAGRIAKVMVSADGGKSWAEAALQGPVHDKAFTRFLMPWRWDGKPAVLMSRAWDEAGNVQPLRAEFVAERGQTREPVKSPFAFPNQHYNSITSWGIDAKGEIKHVYA